MADPKLDEIFEQLAAPFDQVREMPGKGGRPIQYITARDVMNRLDETVGWQNWWDDYESTEHGAICRITVRLPDGSAITKVDGGGSADLDNEDWAEKSSYSGAFKRAAVKLGIGRYLYRDGVPRQVAHLFANHTQRVAAGPNREARREPPQAAPPAPRGEAPARTGGDGEGRRGGGRDGDDKYACPTSGKGLFAWMMERQEEFGVAVLRVVNRHPKIDNVFPGKMTEWSLDQVHLGYDVMVETWKKASVWPTNVDPSYRGSRGEDPQGGASDSRHREGHSEPARDVTPSSWGNSQELLAAKAKVRELAQRVLTETEPDTENSYPNQLRVINEAVQLIHQQDPEARIDNLMTCKDLPLLEEVARQLEDYVGLVNQNTVAVPGFRSP